MASWRISISTLSGGNCSQHQLVSFLWLAFTFEVLDAKHRSAAGASFLDCAGLTDASVVMLVPFSALWAAHLYISDNRASDETVPDRHLQYSTGKSISQYQMWRLTMVQSASH